MKEITIEEVAKITGKTVRTVQRWAKKPKKLEKYGIEVEYELPEQFHGHGKYHFYVLSDKNKSQDFEEDENKIKDSGVFPEDLSDKKEQNLSDKSLSDMIFEAQKPRTNLSLNPILSDKKKESLSDKKNGLPNPYNYVSDNVYSSDIFEERDATLKEWLAPSEAFKELLNYLEGKTLRTIKRSVVVPLFEGCNGVEKRKIFEIMINKKVKYHKNPDQSRYYHRRKFIKTRKLPSSLFCREGRKYSAERALLKKEEDRFIQMVLDSSDIKNPAFIPRRTRKVASYYQPKMEEEFGKKFNANVLRRLIKRRTDLTEAVNNPDAPKKYKSKGAFFFDTSTLDVFSLIQIDGVNLRHIEIRDGETWKKPVIIEFYDTASRAFLCCKAYFAESNYAGVDIFAKFLMENQFPQQRIRLRPDNAKGFRNMERVMSQVMTNFENIRLPLIHLNDSRSLSGFVLDADFAKPGAPKWKVHLESAHRFVHAQEAMMIDRLRALGKEVEKITKSKIISNKQEETGVVRFDMTIDEFNEIAVYDECYERWNNSTHQFTVNDSRSRWCPDKVLSAYLEKRDTITFTEKDVLEFYKYGYNKDLATISENNNGKFITYKKRQWYITQGNFTTHQKVKVSLVNGKLYIFEKKANGICIGEAMPAQKYEIPEKKKDGNIEKGEIELIIEYLERLGMQINDGGRKVIIDNYGRGKGPLNLSVAQYIINADKKKYFIDCNLGENKEVDPADGRSGFRLFRSDLMKYRNNALIVKPYEMAK